MTIKNRSLMRLPSGNKESTMPDFYKESKLFTRKHPRKEGSDYAKSETIPDDQLEDLEPDEDDLMTKTHKATLLLNSFVKSQVDTTGILEGKFKVSVAEMISNLNKLVSAEYSQWFRYYYYSLVLKGHYRDTLAEHLEDHAGEELGHAERLAIRVLGIGGQLITSIESPKLLEHAEEILKELLYREQEGMSLYRKVLALCGDNEGTRQILEGNMEQEQEHIDDLWRMLSHPEMIKSLNKAQSAGRDTMPSEKQAEREYDHGFARYPAGISGSATPDLPERGRDWHNEFKEGEEEKEGEKDQKESEGYFKGAKKALIKKSLSTKFNKGAIKDLSKIPSFEDDRVCVTPKKAYFLREVCGRKNEDIKKSKLNSQEKTQYSQWLSGSIRKSIDTLVN